MYVVDVCIHVCHITNTFKQKNFFGNYSLTHLKAHYLFSAAAFFSLKKKHSKVISFVLKHHGRRNLSMSLRF